jgi:hypothetical protein
MLNDKQKWLLRNMLDICEDKKVYKLYLHNYCEDDNLFKQYFSKSQFNSSADSREMTDNLLAITLDQNNPYIVVSSKSGVYITKDIAEKDAYILRLRDEANAKHKLASDIARLPLNGQIRVVAI